MTAKEMDRFMNGHIFEARVWGIVLQVAPSIEEPQDATMEAVYSDVLHMIDENATAHSWAWWKDFIASAAGHPVAEEEAEYWKQYLTSNGKLRLSDFLRPVRRRSLPRIVNVEWSWS